MNGFGIVIDDSFDLDSIGERMPELNERIEDPQSQRRTGDLAVIATLHGSRCRCCSD